MTTAHDVAAYILAQQGPMSAMKLQKLLYYSQAWSLVWDDKPLFGERIEAWSGGPVVREIYNSHRGKFGIDDWPEGNGDALDGDERETVDAVLKFYGDRSPQWLSDLTRAEEPWQKARGDCAPNVRVAGEITLARMAEFYGSLPKPPHSSALQRQTGRDTSQS